MSLNLEHVAPCCQWADQVFDGIFVDALWAHDQQRGGTRTREDATREWYYIPINGVRPGEKPAYVLEVYTFLKGTVF